jgi:predicted RNA binding protein YcfA (HicA-like mRNA interferase family)
MVPYGGRCVLGRCEKLVRKARESPGNLRFSEACRLARCLGFEQVRRTAGSHRVFKKPGVLGLINLQERDGQAIAYQVRQILRLAEELGLLDEEGGS